MQCPVQKGGEERFCALSSAGTLPRAWLQPPSSWLWEEFTAFPAPGTLAVKVQIVTQQQEKGKAAALPAHLQGQEDGPEHQQRICKGVGEAPRVKNPPPPPIRVALHHHCSCPCLSEQVLNLR